jgi:hypothetical protein
MAAKDSFMKHVDLKLMVQKKGVGSGILFNTDIGQPTSANFV